MDHDFLNIASFLTLPGALIIQIFLLKVFHELANGKEGCLYSVNSFRDHKGCFGEHFRGHYVGLLGDFVTTLGEFLSFGHGFDF